MARPDNDPENELYNSRLYKALTQEKREKIVELCREAPEGPLRVVSVHGDTVLHLASYSKQFKLVAELLEIVSSDQLEKMTHQNDKGNTILHEAAAFNKLVPAAKTMLRKAPDLLSMHNIYGETPLYRAVRYGRERMFAFLDREVEKKYQKKEYIYKEFYQKKDTSSNILHTAVSAEHFDLALLIASKYDYLVGQRDNKGRTALQILASISSAFRSRHRISNLRRFMYRFISAKVTPDPEEAELGWRVPWWEASQKKKRKYDLALDLAEFLVEKDTSWKATNRVQEVEGNENSSSTSKQIKETPLFTATKSGCIDIVEKILNRYPQTVELVDDNNYTILHVAIKYRQMEVFDMVEKMKFPMTRLIRTVDKNLNSILHMVGEAEERNVLEGKMRSPALKLQDNLLLFERVKKISLQDFFRHVNADGQTAEELFAQKNEELRGEAKVWLKDTAQNCSIVAVLIATVAFAAAYTVPGGSNQETGAPILLNQTFFVIFTISDVLSLTFTLTSVVIFLSILTSSFQLKDFKQSLPQQLMLGVSFLIFSVSMMMLAFAATIILMIRNRQQWTKIALYTVAFLPVSVFAVSYMPLYFSLMKTFKYSLKKIGAFFPRYFPESRDINTSNISKSTEIQSSTSNPSPPPSSYFSRMRYQCIQEMLEKIRSVLSCKPQITSSPNSSETQPTDSTLPSESQETRFPV